MGFFIDTETFSVPTSSWTALLSVSPAGLQLRQQQHKVGGGVYKSYFSFVFCKESDEHGYLIKIFKFLRSRGGAHPGWTS